MAHPGTAILVAGFLRSVSAVKYSQVHTANRPLLPPANPCRGLRALSREPHIHCFPRLPSDLTSLSLSRGFLPFVSCPTVAHSLRQHRT
jgi:hypothetical protein